MTEEPKEAPKKQPMTLGGEPQPQTYVVLPAAGRVIINRQWEAVPGDIVDLSHLAPETIKAFVAAGWYATAAGEPINQPAAPVEPCKNCPDRTTKES